MPESARNIRLPDADYWREQINCQFACPVHTDSRGYVRAIAQGNDEEAYLIARGPNPLASICGRVCGAPCESECRRGELDQPVAIRALKRYVCEQFGPEARKDGGQSLVQFLTRAAARHGHRQCEGREELLPLLQALTGGEIEKIEGKSVAIIGSGPAGLATAHDLALMGLAVTIYEMEPVLAGMLALGVPEYRLPRDLIRAEVEVITAMGVQAVTGCCVGKDISFAQLRSRHDAVVVAVGAKKSRELNIPGSNAQGVLGGVEFLRDVSLGEAPELGKKLVVIGGGNVAYDVGRTVLRQISVDAARTAMRTEGVGQVHLVSLESLEEMPADDLEIIEGDEEGIVRRNSMGPKEILTDEQGRVRGVLFQRCLRVFDEQRRFSPIFDENDTEEIPCDNVLISVGQAFDLDFIDAGSDGIKMARNGLIECDPETGVTSAADVFVAGDLAYGTKLLIHAVASGKAVARAIYHALTGKRITAQELELHFPQARYRREPGYEKIGRRAVATAPVRERITSTSHEVEHGFAADDARCEASRCFDCGVNTIFNGEKCVLCGGCVDVCPQKCLRIVSLREITEAAGDVSDACTAQLAGCPAEDASAIIKDENICIRCGLCAERCPTGTITMERFHFEEKPKCLVD